MSASRPGAIKGYSAITSWSWCYLSAWRSQAQSKMTYLGCLSGEIEIQRIPEQDKTRWAMKNSAEESCLTLWLLRQNENSDLGPWDPLNSEAPWYVGAQDDRTANNGTNSGAWPTWVGIVSGIVLSTLWVLTHWPLNNLVNLHVPSICNLRKQRREGTGPTQDTLVCGAGYASLPT